MMKVVVRVMGLNRIVLGEVDDGTESVSTLSAASNKFKVHGKRKKIAL